MFTVKTRYIYNKLIAGNKGMSRRSVYYFEVCAQGYRYMSAVHFIFAVLLSIIICIVHTPAASYARSIQAPR